MVLYKRKGPMLYDQDPEPVYSAKHSRYHPLLPLCHPASRLASSTLQAVLLILKTPRVIWANPPFTPCARAINC